MNYGGTTTTVQYVQDMFPFPYYYYYYCIADITLKQVMNPRIIRSFQIIFPTLYLAAPTIQEKSLLLKGASIPGRDVTRGPFVSSQKKRRPIRVQTIRREERRGRGSHSHRSN